MGRIFGFMTSHPWPVLTLLLALTVLATTQLIDLRTGEVLLEFDPSMNALLADDEETAFYRLARTRFGGDETIIVALSADDIFTRDNLSRVERLSERLADIEHVHHVLSLTTAPDVLGYGETIEMRRLLDVIPDDPDRLAEIRRRILTHPIYAGNLVARDGRTTALIVYFNELSGDFSEESFLEGDIDAEIVRIAQQEAGDAEVLVTGSLHIKKARHSFFFQDLSRSLPLIVLVLGLVLVYAFRTVRGVFIPLATVIVGLLWTLGFAASTGRPLNLVTGLIPPLLLILGLSNTMHVIAEYYDIGWGEANETHADGILHAVGRVSLPLILTGLTTGAGFVAMWINPIGAIREFGRLAVVGVFATVVASLTVPPTLLALLGPPHHSPGWSASKRKRDDWFAWFTTSVAAFDLKHRTGIRVAAGGIFVAACLAAALLRVGGNSMENFPADSPVRRDFEAVNARLDGANTFNVVLEAHKRETFTDPAVLRAVENLQDWLEAQPEIGGTTSVVDYVKQLYQAARGGDPAYFRIPETKSLVATLLLLVAGEQTEGFVDLSYRTANVTVRANVTDTERVSALTKRIDARMAELPEHFRGTVTRNAILVNRAFKQIAQFQAYSVLFAFVLIYLILWGLVFANWLHALVALVPNTLPVAVYFGALGISGVPLSFATSLIAPMALGVAIDDTIHYFTRFNDDARRLADERTATATALKTVGRPVTYTTIAICLGFLMLTVSDLASFVQFGALAPFTLAFAWVVDFTLTPALGAGLPLVTLWDTLTYDLGEDPKDSIPIFKGLTTRQCRIVALMASVGEFTKGHPLIRTDESEDEIYVVIDGAVSVWIEGEQGRREVTSYRRGGLVGQVGFFGGLRSMNVDVIEDARLLRLTPEHLENLLRRKDRGHRVPEPQQGKRRATLPLSTSTPRHVTLTTNYAAAGRSLSPNSNQVIDLIGGTMRKFCTFLCCLSGSAGCRVHAALRR